MSVFSNRERRLYLGGTLLASFGDKVLFVASAIWVRDLSGSNSLAGLTFMILLLPGLVVGPFAGSIADRFSRRIVLIVANLASTASLVPLLFIHSGAGVPIIYAVMFLYGFFGTVQSAADMGLRSTVYTEAEYGAANAFIQTFSEGMRLVTPLVGAGLFVLIGGPAIAAIDLSALLLATVAFVLLRVKEEPIVHEDSHWRVKMLAGVHHITGTPVLRRLAIALGVILSTFGFLETIIFAVVTDGLGKPAAFVGVAIFCQGIGAAVGGPFAAKVIRRVGEVGTVLAGTALCGVGSVIIFATAFASRGVGLPLLFVGAAIMGVGVPWLLVGFMTAMQRVTPNAIMGRVDAAFSFLFSGIQGASIGLGALLVTLVGWVIPLAFVVAAAVAGCAILGIRAPVMPIIEGEDPLPSV
jgi:MFS family permease